MLVPRGTQRFIIVMTGKKKTYITTKDYSVSKEEFNLLYHNDLDMLETFPAPKPENLHSYYESESYISHTDASRSITDRLYQLVKKYTLKKKLKLLNSFQTSEKTLLDIGCGTGAFVKTCINDNWQVVGVEPNDKARAIAKSNFTENSRIEIYNDLFEIKSDPFDIITMWHVLEHVPDLNFYITYLKSLLKPTGYLIVAVPNFKSYDAKYYKQWWAGYDVPRHLWHFSQKAIKGLFLKNGMSLVKILPMKFDSFYVSLLSEQYKTGKTHFLKAFCIGLLSNIYAKRTTEFSSLIYVLKRAEN